MTLPRLQWSLWRGRQSPWAANSQTGCACVGAGWQAWGAGGIRGAGQVLSKGIDIILKERLPETVAHVERWIADVSVNPARRLAVISRDHGVFKGVGRRGDWRGEGGVGGGELAMRQS